MTEYRPLNERLNDFQPVEIPLPPEAMQLELKRCQDCGIPFCHGVGCPLDNVVPEINQDAAAGRWDSALMKLLATSPFPEFTAQVCPALCEGSCVQGLNGVAVPCRQVEYAVIERGFAASRVRPRPPVRRNNVSIGVIGSGPAGLAAAWRLNQAGFRVTVYERAAKAGGFLRYGIPDFKLAKDVLDRRIKLMEAEGVAFEYGVEAGTDLSERLLFRRHEALVLAVGSRAKRDLAIPGRNLAGIHFATDYLTAQNRLIGGEIEALPPQYNARGRRVVVVGGGDTGSDCVGTAWRQGAASVSQFEIMPQPPETRAGFNPWPEWPRILRTSSSHEEGGRRRWNISTLEFLAAPGDSSRLGGLQCREVKWLEDNGRLVRPEDIVGSDFIEAADMALLALGFTGVEPEGPLWSGDGARPDKSGRIPRGRGGRVSDNLYACGDAATGPSLVVRAIADGLAVAAQVAADHAGGGGFNSPPN